MPLRHASFLISALSGSLAVMAQSWEYSKEPCPDSVFQQAAEGETLPGRSFVGERFADDPCSAEAAETAALFPPHSPEQEDSGELPKNSPRSFSRASFAIERHSGGTARPVTRHAAAREGWEHRVELRDHAMTRRRMGFAAPGWRVTAGDLDDTATPAWPALLPRRALPRGWRPAQGTPESPEPLAAPRLQGLSAGTSGPGWKAYAVRGWNPVESGDEPPWHRPWNLRHIAAGFGFASPWMTSLHVSETRAARGDSGALDERLLAAAITSPKRGLSVTAALMESDRAEGIGRIIAAEGRRRVGNAATIGILFRQRDGRWVSAWDPAVPGDGVENDSAPGAGEARLSGSAPLFRARLRGEAWDAWNPKSGTRRRGARGALEWRMDDVRLKLSGTLRTARSASGSVTAYRSAEAEARTESFPRGRVAAWRAWNRDGPLRAGIFLGAAPEWGPLRLEPGYRLEADAQERPEGLAALGLRWRLPGGWRLEADAAAPCCPPGNPDGARWRMAVAATGR